MRSAIRRLAVLPIVLAALSACGGAQSDTQATSASGAHAQADLVDTASSDGSFKTLVASVKAADLVDTLKGPGQFTVFAPTDDAFGKLPAGTLDSLLKPENKPKLQEILTYHVVSGRLGSDQVAHMTSAKTVEGKDLKISTAADGAIMVDGAKIVKTDIACSNGIIHVIDSVLLPP